MNRITTTLLAVLALGLAVAGCTDQELPGEQDIVKVFTTTDRAIGIEPAAPTKIPILAVSELEDWRSLCDQCHRGPHYSSYTILEWGHRESCLESTPCHECHSESLHLTRIRGHKSKCYECHLNQSQPVSCDTCHGEGCWDQAIQHDDEFLDDHGNRTAWQDLECLTCHGSNNWCLDCHGVDMPHPEEILDSHPSLVKGEPEVCNACHGEKSCETCHDERGVVPDLEEYFRAELGLTR